VLALPRADRAARRRACHARSEGRRLKRRALHAAVTVAALVLLGVLARRVHWEETLRTLRTASPLLLLLATGINFGSLLLKGFRWWLLLRATLPALPVALALRAAVVASGLNNLLVANGGDAARVLLVARATGARRGDVLASLLLDQLLEVVGYAALLLVATTVLPVPPTLARWRAPVALVLAVAGAALTLLVRRSRRSPGERAPGPQAPDAAPGALARLTALLRRFLHALAAAATGPRLGQALLVTAFAWLLQLATYAMAARAAHLSLPLAGSVAALVVVNMGLLVRATPGNVGIFQALYALAVAPFGVAAGSAIAASALIQALQIAPVTVAALLLAPELASRRPPADAGADAA